jgi:hypothetical protein
MLTGYTTALPPSALPPIDVPAMTVDVHLLGVALIVALVVAAGVIVARSRGTTTARDPVLRVRAASSARRAA